MRKANHFLVVDDNPAARYIAGDAMEEAGIVETIMYCKNRVEALSYVKENCLSTAADPDRQCPELILLDVNKPLNLT